MARKRKYTHEYLLPFIARSTNWADLLRNLGLVVGGGNYRQIQTRAREYGIDTSHFTGQGWAKGLTKTTSGGIAANAFSNSMPDEDVFKKNSGYQSGHLLKRLLKTGRERQCEECGLSRWADMEIPLDVHHKNGDSSDHRLCNLIILCPNCHAIHTRDTRKKARADPARARANRAPVAIKKVNVCLDCGAKISRRAKRCKSCAGKINNKGTVEWPTTNAMIELMDRLDWNYSAAGRELGVSDNAVRKHIKTRGII